MTVERKLWMRLGVSLRITPTEEAAIFCGDDVDASTTLRHIIAEGRYDLDGESYIPEASIEDFNRDYGTDYCTEELGIVIE